MNTRFLGAARPRAGRGTVVRLLLAATLGTIVTVALAFGSASTASAASSAASMAPSTYEKQVQYWVNVRRRAHGLAPVRLASCTDHVAERWAAYLADHNLFFHQSMQAALSRCDARYAGETLGRGDIRPRVLVRMWMHSDGHRAILLSRQARRIGVGAKPDAHGRWVVAANFMRF